MNNTESIQTSSKRLGFRFSFTHLLITVLLFSTSFTSFENAFAVTFAFLLIVNVTSFSNEYFVIQYLKKNSEKKSNKIYANFVAFQVVLTVIMFVVYKFIIL